MVQLKANLFVLTPKDVGSLVVSSYQLAQPPTHKDSLKGSSISRYFASSIFLFLYLKVISLIPSFSGKRNWKKERTQLLPRCLEKSSTDMCIPRVLPTTRFHTGASLVLILWASSASPLLVLLSPHKAHFGGVQSLGCQPSWALI